MRISYTDDPFEPVPSIRDKMHSAASGAATVVAAPFVAAGSLVNSLNRFGRVAAKGVQLSTDRMLRNQVASDRMKRENTRTDIYEHLVQTGERRDDLLKRAGALSETTLEEIRNRQQFYDELYKD